MGSLFAKTSHHQGAQLDDAIEHADGFAQVFPEHKFHIVDVFQKHGHITGMTGDRLGLGAGGVGLCPGVVLPQ